MAEQLPKNRSLDNWSLDEARTLYRVAVWGEGYFDVNERGAVEVRPRGDRGAAIDMDTLIAEMQRTGLRLPVLARFTDILGDRVDCLCDAFKAARSAHHYSGAYTVVYPIKVNQQRTVVEHIVAAGGDRVGLEAGSKPELMAVLALAPAASTIVCNGYKDRAFLRLALAGQQMGHRVFIVVEKPSELTHIAAMAREIGVRPTLGLRVRLASVAAGHWQNTGGEKSKFGLTAAQVVDGVEQLRALGYLDCLRMLHVHVGSQVADRAALGRAMRETAHLYRALRELGAPVDCVDVGGGLAVDYEGRGARSFCSMNYSVADYAALVVGALRHVCDMHGLAHPDIISESGRALTAHHAVLLTQVIDSEQVAEVAPAAVADGAPAAAWLTRAQTMLDTSRDRFVNGEIGLAERAAAERKAWGVYRALAERAGAQSDHEHGVAAEKLAVKYFCNFSVFQSVPDVWALDQVFPVMPLTRLNEAPTERARLCDLTCDSDGRLDRYVDADGVDATLPLHSLIPGEPYRLGIFMVGAYQENLGDMHNLFGDTDVVNVELTDTGQGWRLAEAEQGDRADELLRYVHFEPEALRDAYRRKLDASPLDAAARAECYALLEAGLTGYTYLLES